MRQYLLLLLSALVLSTNLQAASQFRAFIAIGPQATPDDAISVKQIDPVPEAVVRKAFLELLSSYNTNMNRFNELLSARFVDKELFIDDISRAMPKDARWVLRSMRGITTIRQYNVAKPDGTGFVQHSDVAFDASTEIHATNAQGQFFREAIAAGEFIAHVTRSFSVKP